jgi:hypothetical protein
MRFSKSLGNTTQYNDRALAEVIGFVLILCLIVIFLVIWITYTVPAQGREEEIEHMNYIKDWFTDYKFTLDSLWMNNKITAEKDPLSGVLLSSSLDLGTLGGNTQSSGLFLPFMEPIGSYGTIRIPDSDERLVLHLSDGSMKNFPLDALEYSSGNNYWIPQTYYYQMGGVFLRQQSGTYARIPPDVTIEPNPLRLNITPIHIIPAAGAVEFTGSAGARIDSRMTTKTGYIENTYAWVNLTFILRDATTAKAWQNALHEIRVRNGIPEGNCDVTRLDPPGNIVSMNVSPQVVLRVFPTSFVVSVQPIGANLLISPTQTYTPGGDDVLLNTLRTGTALQPGYFQFRILSDYSFIVIDGTRYELANGDIVRLTVNSPTSTGYIDGYPSSMISTFSISDVTASVNGRIIDTGSVTDIWVGQLTDPSSTLGLFVPAVDPAVWTHFRVGDSDMVYGMNGQRIVLSGMTYNRNGIMNLNIDGGYFECGASYSLG